MTHSLLNPVVLISLIGLVLVLLGYLFDAIKPCRRFAPLCRFLCLGIIVGLLGEFTYDSIERWLSQNLLSSPSPDSSTSSIKATPATSASSPAPLPHLVLVPSPGDHAPNGS